MRQSHIENVAGPQGYCFDSRPLRQNWNETPSYCHRIVIRALRPRRAHTLRNSVAGTRRADSRAAFARDIRRMAPARQPGRASAGIGQDNSRCRAIRRLRLEALHFETRQNVTSRKSCAPRSRTAPPFVARDAACARRSVFERSGRRSFLHDRPDSCRGGPPTSTRTHRFADN